MLTSQQKAVQRKKDVALPKANEVENVPVESIQRSMGNQGLTDYLFSSFQVSDPKDASEREAERTADRVMMEHSEGGTNEIQRAPSDEGIQCAEESGQAGEASFAYSAATGMPQAVQTKMETAFGRSFDNVRLHRDTQADTLSRSLHADAFTKGNDIYFRQDAYDMSTKKGQHLLAHELTHVAQYDGGLHRTPHEGELHRANTQSTTQTTQQTTSPTTTQTTQQTNTPEKTPLQQLAENDKVFCKFVDLLNSAEKRNIIKTAASTELDSEEPSQNGGIGIASDMISHVSGGIDQEKEKQKDSDIAGAVFDTASAGTSVASTGVDIAKKVKDKKDKQAKLDELFTQGDQAASMSGKEKWEIAGNVIGSAASATGAGASITKAAGAKKGAAITGLVGDSLTVGSDLIGIGVQSADLHETRTKNNEARAQIMALIQKAAGCETEQSKKELITPLTGKVSSDKDGNGTLRFNAAVDEVLAKDISSQAKNALRRAKFLNTTRQVSREMKNEKSLDLGSKVFGTLNDIRAVVGDAFDVANNEAVSNVLSVIGGFASILGGLFDGAKAIYNEKKKENRQNNADTYARDVLENMYDSLNEEGRAEVTSAELETPLTDEKKIESGEIFRNCYMGLQAGNVDMLDFLLGVKNDKPTEVKKAVVNGYVNH